MFTVNNMKLICFAYAGGSSAIYFGWQPHFGTDAITVFPFELPGRGARMGEALHTSMESLINHIVPEVIDLLERRPDDPYCFFGHSMGGLIAFELTKKLAEAGYSSPERLFISAKGSPCTNHLIERYSVLNEADFLQKLHKDGGVTDEFVHSDYLQETFMPIIRADYRLIETYEADLSVKVDCPLTVFYGTEDKISRDEVMLWANYTNASASFIAIDGGHFYIWDRYPELIRCIGDQLLPETMSAAQSTGSSGQH